MALTLLNLKSHAQLDGNLSDAFDATEVVNEAGSYLFDMHAWNCLVAPPSTLSLIEDQSYVSLPADFGKMVAYAMTSGLTSSLSFTSPQELAAMRSTSITVQHYHYWAAISHPSQVQPNEQPVNARLELWPTPASSSAGAITIWYRRRWRELDDDTDAPDMPRFLNPLLRRIVRIFALSYDEEDTGQLEERLETIENSQFYTRLKEHDGLEYPDMGTLVGGAIQERHYFDNWRRAAASAVADPS